MDEEERKQQRTFAARLICAYEAAIGTLEADRSTYATSDGDVALNGGFLTEDLCAYATDCREYLKFVRQVNACLSNLLDPYNALYVGMTPDLYVKMGLQPYPVLYTQKHLRQVVRPKSKDNIHLHGIPAHTIKRLPQLLKEPVLVYDSPDFIGRMCVVLNAVDNDNDPLFAVIEPNSSDGVLDFKPVESSNFLVTVHGRMNLESTLRHKVKLQDVVYFDKEKGQELESVSGVRFPRRFSELDHRTIIHQPRCVCNRHQTAKSSFEHKKATAKTKSDINVRSILKEENMVQKQNDGETWANFTFAPSQVYLRSGVSENTGKEWFMADCRFMPGSNANGVDLGNQNGEQGHMKVWLNKGKYLEAMEQKANKQPVKIGVPPSQFKDGTVKVEFGKYDKELGETPHININPFTASAANKAARDAYHAQKEAERAAAKATGEKEAPAKGFKEQAAEKAVEAEKRAEVGRDSAEAPGHDEAAKGDEPGIGD